MVDNEKLAGRIQEITQKHSTAQEACWEAFRNKLDNLQTIYKIPVRDIAKGLGISAQTFYDFKPKEGKPKIPKLNIDRSNVLTLWDCLTDEELTEGLSAQKKELRRELAKEGVDELLKAAGFLPTSEYDKPDTSGVDLSIPGVQPILSRLSSRWLQDDDRRAYLTNSFLDQIVDQGRSKNSSNTLLNEQAALRWPEEMRYKEKLAKEKYAKEIKRLVLSGKAFFLESELFELYQSTLEHNFLNQPKILEKIDIVDCQFETLSTKTILSKYKMAKEKIEDLEEFIEASIQRAEIELVGISELYNEKTLLSKDIRRFLSNPVISALIECEYVEDEEVKATFTFRFASTSTHIENMLYAFKNGLGYSLKISGFFMRATGSNENSLSRVVMALSEEKELHGERLLPEDESPETFQGWWVTSNTLIGILKSVSGAVQQWLLKREGNISTFYEVCRDLAEVSEKFFKIQSSLYESTPIYSEFDFNLNEEIEKFIRDSENLKKRREEILDSADKIHLRHFHNLNNEIEMAKLMRMRVALVDVELNIANLYVSSAVNLSELKLDRIKNPHELILSVYSASCMMLYKLIAGDKRFLEGGLWRESGNDYSLDSCLNKLKGYRERTGLLDFNLYLCASHIFGFVGQLELYSATTDEHDSMKKGIEYFIQAAHFSSRIGHSKRTSQWLAYASRMYCRLGDAPKAESLSILARQFLPQEQNPGSEKTKEDSSYVNWPWVYLNIVDGERAFLLGSYQKALEHLEKALEASIQIGFTKIFPDIIYNLSRVISFSDDKGLIEEISNFLERLETELVNSPSNASNKFSKLFKKRVEIIQKLKEASKERQSFVSVSSEEAASIWNEWAKFAGAEEHPFVPRIRNHSFLSIPAR